MAERHPTNGTDGVRFYRVGSMVDADRIPIEGMELVIDDVGHGQHWYFCMTDNMVFPCNASCPACGRSIRPNKHAPASPQDATFTPSKGT